MSSEGKAADVVGQRYTGVTVTAFGGPEALEISSELGPLAAPGPGEVALALHYAGVNPVETYIRAGTYARKPALPYTPGNDGAGVVAAVGEGVSHVKPGDRVYCTKTLTGSYAQAALAPADAVHLLPDSVSFATGVAVGGPAATAYRALFQRSHAKPGQWVLVHGASGGVGVAAVEFARAAGCKVIGTAGSEAGMALVKSVGADVVLQHGTEGGGPLSERVLAATDGHGADVILEMLANVNLGADLTMLAKGGVVAVVGSRGTVEVNPRDLMSREASVVGVALAHATPEELKEIHAATGAALRAGTLKAAVGLEFPLEEAPAAHVEVIEHAKGTTGKIVLRLRD